MDDEIEPFLPGCDPNILIDEGFLIPASAAFSAREPSHGKSVMPHRLHLLLSRHCHGKCMKCFQGPAPPPMSAADACAALDIFFALQDSSSRALSIVLDGLGATVDPSLLLHVIPYIRKKEGTLSGRGIADIELRTGALPATSELSGLLKENQIRVKVFFEGREEDYSPRPHSMSHGASYRDAVRGYRGLQKKGLEPEILCAVGLNTIHRLSEIGRFFAIDLECRRLHFIPRYHPDDASVPALLFAERILELFRFLRNYGIYEERIMTRLLPFVNEEPVPFYESPWGGQIVVSPGGALYCGAIDDNGKPEASAYLADYRAEVLCSALQALDDGRKESGSSHCTTCMARSLCGGKWNCFSMASCPLMPGHLNSHCLETKAMLHWFLRDLAEGFDIPMGEGSLITTNPDYRGGD